MRFCLKKMPAGYTLVETLIVLAIFGIVAAGIYAAFNSGQKEYAVRQAQLSMQQQSRQAMSALQKDLKMIACGLMDAGNLKINVNVSAPWAIVEAIDGNQSVTPLPAAPNTDVLTFRYLKSDPDAEQEIFLSAPALSSAPSTPIYVTSTAGFSVGDYYMTYDPTDPVKPATMLQVTALSANSLFHKPVSKYNPSGGAAKELFPAGGYRTGSRVLNLHADRLRYVKFYVDTQQVLVREQQDTPDGDLQIRPVASGVEDLQLEYQFKNGTWKSAPVAGDPDFDINNLRAIRVSIIVRTEKSDPAYTSDAGAQIVGVTGSGAMYAGGGYRRMLMSTTIDLRNLGLRG